jgi:hypothetical protein
MPESGLGQFLHEHVVSDEEDSAAAAEGIERVHSGRGVAVAVFVCTQ